MLNATKMQLQGETLYKKGNPAVLQFNNQVSHTLYKQIRPDVACAFHSAGIQARALWLKRTTLRTYVAPTELGNLRSVRHLNFFHLSLQKTKQLQGGKKKKCHLHKMVL